MNTPLLSLVGEMFARRFEYAPSHEFIFAFHVKLNCGITQNIGLRNDPDQTVAICDEQA